MLENLVHAHAHIKKKKQVAAVDGEADGGEDTQRSKAPTAAISLIADLFHNFVDGALIGATFLINIKTGFTTTLAIILHELPQVSNFSTFIF